MWKNTTDGTHDVETTHQWKQYVEYYYEMRRFEQTISEQTLWQYSTII